MATDRTDIVRSLELELEEQRRDTDMIDKMYESAKTKNLAFLAASLGLMAYLYSSDQTFDKNTSLSQRLFIPPEPYGIIIYAIAFALFMYGLALLFFALLGQKWMTAYDDEQEDCLMEHGYEHYLRYMVRRYDKVSSTNGNSYNKKQTYLNRSLLPLLLGGTMLLVLKAFGG